MKDYKFTMNMFTDDGKSGLITMTYYIDDVICTNKAYIAIIENGNITSINKSYLSEKSSKVKIDKDELIGLVDTFSKKERKEIYKSITKGYGSEGQFYYDIETGELSYVETYYEQQEEYDGAYVVTSDVYKIK